MYRIGEGFDVHRLETGRRLRVGCIDIPSSVGSVAHSDGDVLAHAVVDAILGAIGEGDIGHHFPPTDARWKDADSKLFLAEAVRLLAEGRNGVPRFFAADRLARDYARNGIAVRRARGRGISSAKRGRSD